MKHIVWVILIPLTSIILMQCSDPVEPVPSTNMLTNGDFEDGQDSSLAGWEWVSGGVTFSSDVPPGDGLYSVRLQASMFAGDIRTMVPAVPGTHIYRLSAWGRMEPGSVAGGKAWMALVKADTVLNEVSINFGDTTWVTKSIGIPITAEPGDSIGVTLRAFYGPIARGFSYFDRIVLEVE